MSTPLPEQQFAAWQTWFFGLVDEVGHLLISRETLRQLADYAAENSSSYDPASFAWFMGWIGSMWGVATATRIRALGDPDSGTKSLRSLLVKIQGHPHVFTRQRYIALTGASDSHTMERSNREFDERFGTGNAVAPALVESDIRALDTAVMDVKEFVDKRVAHLDANWREATIQLRPIYEALAMLGELVQKYHFLFTGQPAPHHFGVLTQFDIQDILQPIPEVSRQR